MILLLSSTGPLCLLVCGIVTECPFLFGVVLCLQQTSLPGCRSSTGGTAESLGREVMTRLPFGCGQDAFMALAVTLILHAALFLPACCLLNSLQSVSLERAEVFFQTFFFFFAKTSLVLQEPMNASALFQLSRQTREEHPLAERCSQSERGKQFCN